MKNGGFRGKSMKSYIQIVLFRNRIYPCLTFKKKAAHFIYTISKNAIAYTLLAFRAHFWPEKHRYDFRIR